MPTDFIPTISPDWPAIRNVQAFCTQRSGGVSEGDHASLNLGDHVSDTSEAVTHNRDLVAEHIRQIDSLVNPVAWLTQVHGTDVSSLDSESANRIADAVIAHSAHKVCAIMTADCLPVLIAAKDGSAVSAVHAGWKGLADGVIEAALAKMPSNEVQVWLGPCIGFDRFEVGPEIPTRFPDDISDPDCFARGKADRWKASLAGLARARLARIGVTDIYGGDFCTYDDPRFFSHRQATHAGKTTGRFASFIWLSA